MKKVETILCWVGMVFFALMAIAEISAGGVLGAVLLCLGALVVAPFKFVKNFREKIKFHKVLTVLLALVLLFVGVAVSPSVDTPQETSGAAASTAPTVTSSADKTTDITTLATAETKTKQTSAKTTKKATAKAASSVGAGEQQSINAANIPAYAGKAYITINNNVPNFSASELKTTGYEQYSELDSLGRTGTALASVGKDTMPNEDEERGSISSIKPSGWKQAKYDCISGGWLYNRCHLIGWQLSAENANRKNLITGTKYLNISGMLPFENMVADYIKESGNHVAYRVTPVYEGNNLLAYGVQMEAYSVEDGGDGICFNVYCYNVQPGVTIRYATGDSTADKPVTAKKATTKKTTKATAKATTEAAAQKNQSQTVIITKSGEHYHCSKDCPGLSRAKALYEVSLSEAKNKGLTPCSKCY